MSEYKKALELALTISARDDYDSNKQSDDKCISQALLIAEEMLKESEGVLEQINPGRKMSDTAATLERRIFDYGEMAKEWLAKRKEMIR